MALKTVIIAAVTSISLLSAKAQNIYKYAVDLNTAKDNHLSVSLNTPSIKQSVTKFSFPKIIPGTYCISDYGQFVSDLIAYDKSGKQLPVKQLSVDQWEIKDANTVAKITYSVEGIFDTKKKHRIFPMNATNISEKNIVISAPGFFGYFDGMNELPVEVTYIKPDGFYGSTSMTPEFTSATKDIFKTKSINELYDEPTMYCKPDTATMQVGNCKVLVSVFSETGKVNAKDVLATMVPILTSVKTYLGGVLPANKYAFIYYFHDSHKVNSFHQGGVGALEHMTSSFYYLEDRNVGVPGNSFVADASTHEFFHIITPLTIHSQEIQHFNFDKPVMSEHLWLYEGSTEYNAHYVQKRYGLIDDQNFLHRLSDKITSSRTQFNDTLPFTVMSKGSAEQYNDQFGNVYQKGALISACVDLQLLNLSNGKYGLHNLTHQLGLKYGANRAFNDNDLFNEIEKLTYPQLKDFLVKYVAGPTPIPYDQYFALAGIKFIPKVDHQVVSLGKVRWSRSPDGKVSVAPNSPLNDFGKAMGYKAGDIVYSINSTKVDAENLQEVVENLQKNAKEGDMLTVEVGRKDENGNIQPLTLSGKMVYVTVSDLNVLEFMPNPTPQQLLVRNAWLTPQNDKNNSAIK